MLKLISGFSCSTTIGPTGWVRVTLFGVCAGADDGLAIGDEVLEDMRLSNEEVPVTGPSIFPFAFFPRREASSSNGLCRFSVTGRDICGFEEGSIWMREVEGRFLMTEIGLGAVSGTDV